MAENGIGASVPRTEDHRFLTGTGDYTDDTNLPRQTYAAFVRSTHPHATFTLDASAAATAPGVVAVLTGADMAGDGVGSLICGWVVTGKDGEPHRAPPHPVLATDTVRHVGDAMAIVVAESAEAARDAAEQVDVTYSPLPAAVTMREALAEGGPQIHPEAPGNLCYDWEIGDRAATDDAFARAHHVARLDLVNNRLIPNAMEPRAAIGDYNPATRDYTLRLTSQNPHIHRLVLAAFIQIAPEHKLHVIAPDVGGGFGSKIFIYQEETAVLWAAGKVGRPVKWTADRSESFVADAHGRDHETRVELALDAGGRFLGLKVATRANMGAYLSTFASCVPSYLYGTLLQGQYTTEAIHCEVKAVFTNTTPVDALRGAGRPEATYVVERIVDQAAHEMGIDPAELRRRNFIPADAFPYPTKVALEYDSGTTASRWTARWRSRATRASPPAARRRRRRGSSAGSGSAPTSRPAASHPPRWWDRWGRASASGSRAAFASIPPGTCSSTPAPTATARDTRPRSRRSFPTTSEYRSRTSRWYTATPRRRRSAWAPTARVRSR